MALVPPVSHPLFDQTGRVSLPWHKYFLALSGETGGGGGGGGGGAITGLTGDVVATGPGVVVAELSDTGVTPGTYGDSTHVGQFTVDVDGRLTLAANVPIDVPGLGRWEPVMTGAIGGDPSLSELVLDSDGDCIMAFIPA